MVKEAQILKKCKIRQQGYSVLVFTAHDVTETIMHWTQKTVSNICEQKMEVECSLRLARAT